MVLARKYDIWNLEQHFHPSVELFYFLDGRAKINGEKDDLLLSVYDLLICPEKVLHQEIVRLGIELPQPLGLENTHRLTDFESRLK